MSNLYQPTFEMDESFRVNRWARPSEENHETMAQYSLGGQLNRQYRDTLNTMKSGVGESHRRYVTEVSQTSNVDGFRKTKHNQMETLKELRQ
jgi:hypothetical protein